MGLEHLRHLERAGRVLEPRRHAEFVDHGRVAAAGPAAELILHQWWVRWDAGAVDSFRQRVLSDPVLHLTFEAATGPLHGYATPVLLVHGVVRRVFEVDLPARGRVSGVALQPGALAAGLGLDVSTLTGRVVPAAEVFGAEIQELADALVEELDESIRREILAAYLVQRIPADALADPTCALVRAAGTLVEEGDFTRVDELAAALHVSPRTLQRAFPRLVGVPPLWVIRRRRLQRVAERLDAGEAPDLAALAAELGFADQAHLSREFRAVIGRPPSVYRAGGDAGEAG